MAVIQINQITNANIYLDGNSVLGRATEIKLPDIKIKTAEHKGLGMFGAIDLPTGVEKLEGEITWNSYYAEVAAKYSNPFKYITLQCRSNLESYDSNGRTSEKPLVTFLTVMFTKHTGGSHKPGEKVEIPTSFSATYIKQIHAGKEVLELDFMANIFKVGGEDVLSTYRSNIGG